MNPWFFGAYDLVWVRPVLIVHLPKENMSRAKLRRFVGWFGVNVGEVVPQ